MTESPQFDTGRPNLSSALGCSIRVRQLAAGNTNEQNHDQCLSTDLESMDVTIGGQTVHFDKGECVWTEISQKYSTVEIGQLAIQTGFEVLENVFDGNSWFTDSIWIAR